MGFFLLNVLLPRGKLLLLSLTSVLRLAAGGTFGYPAAANLLYVTFKLLLLWLAWLRPVRPPLRLVISDYYVLFIYLSGSRQLRLN